MQHSILSASQTTGPLANRVKRVGTNARVVIVYSISLRFTDLSFSLAVSHLPTYPPNYLPSYLAESRAVRPRAVRVNKIDLELRTALHDAVTRSV